MKIRKAAGALGAYVSQVNIADVVSSDSVYERLRDVVLEHEVVFLRDQTVSPAMFAAFAQRFGEVLDHSAYPTTTESPVVQIGRAHV